MRTQWMLICALVFALLTAVFAVSNVEPVRVNFLFMSAELPLILVILGSTLLGGVIVFSFGVVRQYRLQREIRLLRKGLEESRGEQAEPGEKADEKAEPAEIADSAKASELGHEDVVKQSAGEAS